MDRITWFCYKLPDNSYISYICAVYHGAGGKTYQKNISDGFEVSNEIEGKDNVLNIELGLLHPKNKEFITKLIIKDDLKAEYEKTLKELKNA